MVEKPVIWVGSAREDLTEFPVEARRQAGHQLRRLQQGLLPGDWRPMPSVGEGVQEIRIRVDSQYRVFYVCKFVEAIYVLHAFAKRSRKTRQRDLEVGRTRLAIVVCQRREGKED